MKIKKFYSKNIPSSIKRIISASLSLMIIISCLQLTNLIGFNAKAETSLVINGGAEDGVTGWTANDEWQKVRVSDTEACTGSKSFMAPLYKNHVQTQVVPVEPSTKYCLTWVEKGDVANGAQMVLNLIYSKNMVTTVTDKWVTRSWTFTSGASATTATIQIKKIVDNTSANIYVDNISLVKVENDSLIKNGGAEYGDADWDGYRNINNNPDNVRSGNYSFETTQQGFYMSQDVVTEPNTQYCLTFAHKGAASDLILKIDGVWRMDINKNETADWQHAYYNFTSSNSSKVTVTFQKDSASDALVYLDDIRLIEVINDEELIKNNGAEYGKFGWTAYDEYRKIIICDDAYTGNYSFKMPFAYGRMEQAVELKANTNYKVSYYTKGSNSTEMVVSTASEGGGNVLASVKMSDVNTDWTLVEKEFLSTTNQTAYLSFNELDGVISNNRLVDDIMISVVNPNADLIVNGGAEAGNANWTPFDNYQTVRVSDTVSLSGAKSFLAPKYKYHTYTQVVPVAENTEYCLTWSVKGTKETVNIVIDGYEKAMATAVSDGWQSGGWIFTTGASATTATIQIKRTDISYNESDNIYIDNVRLQKVDNNALIKNGCAEYSSAEYAKNYWEGYRNICNDPQNVAEGNFSFFVDKGREWKQQNVTLEPDSDYRLTLKHKGDASTMSVEIGGKSKTFNQADTLDWETVTIDFTTSPTQQSTVIKFTGSVPEGKVVYIDEIKLVKLPPEPTLIKNGGAEKDDSGWIQYDQWTKTPISTDAHSGAKSFGIPTVYRYFSQSVELEPDTEYVLSYYTKGSTASEMRLMTDLSDDATTIVHEIMNSANAEWTYVEKKFMSTANQKAYLKFKDISGGDNNRLIDDISLTAVVEFNETVKNGKFENGITNWGYNAVVPPTTVDGGCFGSAKALQMSKEQDGKFYQAVELEVGQDAVFAFYHKGTSDGAKWKLIGGEFSAYSTAPVIAEGTISDATDWTKISERINSGASNKVCIVFENGGQNSTLNIDNVSLKGNKNIVSNGSFESGMSNWNVSENYFAIDDTNTNSGLGALKLKSAVHQFVYQKIYVEEGATKYKVSFYYKGNVPADATAWSIATNAASFSGQDVLYTSKLSSQNPDQWKSVTVVVSVKNIDSFCISFQTQVGYEWYIDDVSAYATSEEVTPYTVTKEPLLIEFQGKQNPYYVGPYICEDSKNLITDNGFENGTGNWNTPAFIGDAITVTDEAVAVYEGQKGLKFKAGDVKKAGTFYVDVEPNTNYYFTVVAKMPKWSTENIGDMTFGVTDAANGSFLIYEKKGWSEVARFITTQNQNNPASPDGEWHLLGIKFASNGATKVGIKFSGRLSEVYFDNMYLFKESDATPFLAPVDNKTPAEISNANPTLIDCDDSLNMLDNANFDKTDVTFWTNSRGFSKNNSIVDSGSSIYGNALHYYNDKEYPDRTYFIKWIDVKPNTTYTFSAKYSVVNPKKDAFFGLLSGDQTNAIYPTVIKAFGFTKGEADKDSKWQTAALQINTNDCDRIGLTIFNGGGEAYIDKIRLFETYASGGTVENGKLPVEETRNSDIPLKLKSDKYTSVDGAISFNEKDNIPTVEDLIATFDGKKYIAVYDKDGNKLTNLKVRLTDGLEIRLMDGPEILDRVKIIIIPEKKPAAAEDDKPETSETPQTNTNTSINNTESVTIITNEADNNLLAELTVENAKISPDFTPENKKYETTVTYDVEKLIIKAKAQSEKATVTISDEELTYVGKNIVKVTVLSESGRKRTYKIYAERLAPEKSVKPVGSNETNLWLIVGIAAAIAVVIAATTVIVIIVAKKKKRKAN